MFAHKSIIEIINIVYNQTIEVFRCNIFNHRHVWKNLTVKEDNSIRKLFFVEENKHFFVEEDDKKLLSYNIKSNKIEKLNEYQLTPKYNMNTVLINTESTIVIQFPSKTNNLYDLSIRMLFTTYIRNFHMYKSLKDQLKPYRTHFFQEIYKPFCLMVIQGNRLTLDDMLPWVNNLCDDFKVNNNKLEKAKLNLMSFIGMKLSPKAIAERKFCMHLYGINFNFDVEQIINIIFSIKKEDLEYIWENEFRYLFKELQNKK